MTTQDLKNSRNEIIAKIKEVGNETFLKEIMTAMVNLINGEMAESSNVIDLVDEVIEMNQNWKKKEVNTLWGSGCKYSTQAEYQRAQLSSKFN